MALAAGSCSLRTLAVTDASGCALTRSSVSGMTPTAIEALANQEIGALLKQATEAKIAGYRENTLEMLLRSNIKSIKPFQSKSNIPGNESVILPYFYRPQKRHISSNYWKITAGAAAVGAGSGGNHSGLWKLTITNHGGTYASALTDINRYFVPGSYVSVDHANASTKAAYRANFKVISAEATTVGGTSAYVIVEPNVTTSTFAGYDSDGKLPWQPAVGLVLNLANSVAKYESWAYNLPSENPRDLLTFWPQTTRHHFRYSDAYLEALNAVLSADQTNMFSAKYSTFLPIAEQNKQQHKTFMQGVLNSAFYGQRINENQAPNTYTSLPGVYDPGSPECLLEYKANALGFMTQLSGCSRVTDSAGTALSLDTLFSTGFDLKRAREATAGQGMVDRIEFMTDRWTFGLCQEQLNEYFQDRYNITSTKYIEPNQKLLDGTEVLANYATYQLPADVGGYEFCLITHPYFDDKVVAAQSGDTRHRVRTLWGLDWSDISLGMGEVINRTSKTNTADNLYNYTVAQNVTHSQNRSLQFCPMIEDPMRHVVVDNFTAACPVITTPGCSPA